MARATAAQLNSRETKTKSQTHSELEHLISPETELRFEVPLFSLFLSLKP